MFTQYASTLFTQRLTAARHRYARSSRPSAWRAGPWLCSWPVSVWGSSSGNSSEPQAERLTTASAPPLRTLSTRYACSFARAPSRRSDLAFGGALPGLASAADVGPKIARKRHRSERCERSAGGCMQAFRLALQHSRDLSRVSRRQRAEPPAQISLAAQHFKTSAAASPAARTARAATMEAYMSRGEELAAWRGASGLSGPLRRKPESQDGKPKKSRWEVSSTLCLPLPGCQAAPRRLSA